MTKYATRSSNTFVPDPKRCSQHWTFMGGVEVQCLLGPKHSGRPCEFMLAGQRMADPRVESDQIPEFVHSSGEHRVYVGKGSR